jgi:hypothetical protein
MRSKAANSRQKHADFLPRSRVPSHFENLMISEVMLTYPLLHEWFDIGRRDQPHLVTERGNFARPMMRAAAGFDPNQACWLLFEKPQHFGPAQLAVHDRGTLSVGGMNLKELLGQI